MAAKRRLDQLLVERGLVESAEKAQALIMAGDVLLNGQKAQKAGQAVALDARLELAKVARFVSRGGLKLAAALEHFKIDARDKVCVDVGASTGGFTDCLLQAGALRVHAIDVGAGQLDWKLRHDPRVILHEDLNARRVTFEDIKELAAILVCDVSFISVTKILPNAVTLLQSDGELVVLVKPQFEVRRGQVGDGGIVRDAELHAAACRRIEEAVQALDFKTELIESPILGAEGNKEFLLHGHH